MTEEEKQNIKEQFNDIVSDGIAPILKAAGFRKRGNNFHAHAGEMDWCINIQKDRWGMDGYFNFWEFTINIGVTNADYVMSLFDKTCDFPLEGACPLRARIGNFMGKGDYWFKLSPNQECKQTKELVCSTIKEKVLPILTHIKCPNDAWKYIKNNDLWFDPLIKLFRPKSEQKVFYASPIGLYMLCLATGKEKRAKLLRSAMKKKGTSTELLDKIQATYEKRKNGETDR